VRGLLLIALFALLLVGCGGGEEKAATAESVDTTATQTDTGETDTGETGTGETGTGETETGETETGETETGETETGGDNEAVEGDAAAGEQVYASNGCGSCHTFEPAGSSGTTGPDLDELSDLAENANQPLADFTRTSITSPNEYVEEGFPEGVMPAYDQLSDDDLNNLVAFLVQG
jgi:mono/diheme cytochrome c family protein